MKKPNCVFNDNRYISLTLSIHVFVLLLVFSSQLHALAAANIKVSTVPEELYENQAFNLIFQTYQSVDGSPDFSPLDRDFTIVHQTQRNNFKMFSGDFQRSDNWVLELIPDKAGKVTIPAIAFGRDHSPSIELTIKENNSENNSENNDHDFISEVDVSSTDVYVRSQIIVTERMLSTKRTARPSFSDLKTSGVDVMLERLDESQTYDVRRGDTLYHAIEVHYALYPQQVGTLTIHPIISVAQVAASGDGSINPLMNNSITRQAASRPVTIKVNPIPDRFNNQNWLPANHVSLTEEWPESNENNKAGEPLTRHLTITVDGLGHTQIPELPVTPVKDLKRYPDIPVHHETRSATGISSSRDIRVVLIPTQPGEYTLPAIEVPWWNMKENKLSVAVIPSRTISISGAPVIKKSIPADAPPNSINDTELAAAEEKARLYLWIATFLALAWASTLLMQFERNRARKRHQQQVNKPKLQSIQSAEKDLKTACKSGRAKDCETALLSWASCLFEDAELTSLGTLTSYVDEPLKAEIAKLEAYLYGQESSRWSPDDLWQASHQFAARHVKQSASSDTITTDIEPLHRK
jgi:hypothetical protein